MIAPPQTLDVEALDGLRTVIARVDAWLRSRDYTGHDPYDYLNSTRLPGILRHTALGRQAVVQFGRRCPLNLRGALGVPRIRVGKALAVVGSGYAQLYRREPHPGLEAIARELLADLEHRRLASGEYACWGYEFDVQTRWAYYPRGTPNIVATTFVAHAFLDWYELTRDAHLLAVAQAAARYLNRALLRDAGGEAYYSYVPDSHVLVHNANILGCALTSRVARLAGDDALLDNPREAVMTTLRRQRPDGFWPYGRGRRLRWVDGFHTGYVLDGLCELSASTEIPGLPAQLQSGFDAYVRGMFTEAGAPKYSPETVSPINIHSAATAIDLMARRSKAHASSLALAERVYRWTMEHMWDGNGFFYYERHQGYTNRIAYVRWSQAHMLKALTSLYLDMGDCEAR